MVSPSHGQSAANRKQSVNLTTPGVRVSRIRRDPPPASAVKEIPVADRDELNRRNALIGIAAFTLAFVVIIFALSSVVGWSPSEYTVHM